MHHQSQMLTLSGRIYNLMLLAYPTRFRRAFGEEMAQVFRDDLRHTLQESGPAGLVGLWILVVIDLVKTAFAEYIWSTAATRPALRGYQQGNSSFEKFK